jgi:hypothetical protein
MQTVPSQVVAAILKFFPGARQPGPLQLHSSQLPQLMAIVGLVRRIPAQLFTVEIEEYVQLEMAIEVIEQTLKRNEQQQYGFPLHFTNNISPIQIMYWVLMACPDDFPASSATNLGFIADPKTRDSISREIRSVESAVRNGEWKAATVLAGAAIEALLLYRLCQFTQEECNEAVRRCVNTKSLGHRPKPDLLEWTLSEMIETAAQLGVLRSNTLTEARQCKNFRNLIHPGRVLASEAECNRGTAFSAVAALDFIVSDLARA